MSDSRELFRRTGASIGLVDLDFDLCYRAVASRDTRFDGWFVTAVTSTGIYCRPSCPAMTPKRSHVRFYPNAAVAQQEGFRACLRCRPDAAPGSPEWHVRGDVAARAMRLIADGVVDRAGVPGLARMLGYTERHLGRILTSEVGTGPLALARAQRAQTARILIETTDLPFGEVAFAAGFHSIRQFNDTVRQIYGRTPSELRAGAGGRSHRRSSATGDGTTITLRLAYRPPLDIESLFAFLAFRALPGVEEADGTRYRRTLRLPHGYGVVTLTPAENPTDHFLWAHLRLSDLRDLCPAVARCRRLLDLDNDPAAVDAVLTSDPAFSDEVAQRPGVRVPRTVDGFEMACRGVVGQQVSVASARKVLGRIVAELGDPLPEPDGGLTHLFPTPEAVCKADDDLFPLPASRRHTLRVIAEAVAAGDITLDSAADRVETRHRLLRIPGIGPWTASYLAMRALGDPDAFLAKDLGVRRGAMALGLPGDPTALTEHAERWRPWRSYATIRLWRHA